MTEIKRKKRQGMVHLKKEDKAYHLQGEFKPRSFRNVQNYAVLLKRSPLPNMTTLLSTAGAMTQSPDLTASMASSFIPILVRYSALDSSASLNSLSPSFFSAFAILAS